MPPLEDLDKWCFICSDQPADLICPICLTVYCYDCASDRDDKCCKGV